MKRLAWQVLPPLLLVPLVRVPFEVFTFLAWTAGLVAVFISALTLLRLTVAQLRSRHPDWTSAIRPALTIAIFAAVAIVSYGIASEEAQAADQLARGVGRETQAECRREGKCPASPRGWIFDADTRRARTVVGRMPLRYVRSDDGTEFCITVRHALEEMLDVCGGSGRELREQRVIR